MNENIKRKRKTIIVTLLVVFGVIYIYIFDPFIEQVRFSPTGLSDFRDHGSYKIDPQTILESLDRGEIDVFTPEIATSEAPIFEEPISWHQSDYMKISSILHQFVWNETLDDWSLYYMNFNTTCNDGPYGFGLGDFYYFKTIFLSNGKVRYAARELFISPQYGDVIWGGRINFPRPLLGWKSVDLEKLKITAEDALRITDENGGEEARSSVQNKCAIQVRLSGDFGWRVFVYDDKTGSSIFRMEIDPYTGEIK